jgi:preprotein translocase subunit SecD
MIREAIRGGTTLVSGSFTATDAKELASTLSTGALPLMLIEQSTQPTTLAGQPASAPLRYTLVGAGVLIALIAVGVLVTIVRRRPRLPADGPVAMADNWFPAPGPSSG